MGASCNKTSEITINEPLKRKVVDEKDERDKLNPRFKNMPEWEGDRYKGVGLKRMKGYICSLQIDKLNMLRDEFWSSKIREKPIWRNIRRSVYMDESKLIIIKYYSQTQR